VLATWQCLTRATREQHGFVTDITELQIRFQANLLDAVGRAVIATDTLGKITYMNDLAESLYGWRYAEAMGLSILDITEPQMS
jgi:PAS domain-containing protein